MKQLGSLQQIRLYIFRAKCIVRSRCVKEYSVYTWRAYYNSIRTYFSWSKDHSFLQSATIFRKTIQYRLTKKVIPYFPHQLNRKAKPVKSQSGIGNRSACRHQCRTDGRQPPRYKQIAKPIRKTRNLGDDIQANMSGYYKISRNLLHLNPPNLTLLFHQCAPIRAQL